MPDSSDPTDALLRDALLADRPVDLESAATASGLGEVFRQLLADDAAVGRARLDALVTGGPGRAGDVAAEALGKWGGPEGIDVLRRALDRDPPKARRKAIKRGLHFAGSPTAEPPTPAPTVLRETAWMGAPAGAHGERVWAFRRTGDPGGATDRTLTIAVLDAGVGDYAWRDGDDHAWSVTRDRLAGLGVTLVEVEWRWLVARVARAASVNGAQGDILPANWDVVAKWLDLGAPDEPPPPHPSQPSVALLDLPEPPSPDAMHAVLELPETSGWMLPPEALRDHLDALRAADASQLVLEGRDPRERIEGLLQTILDELTARGDTARWADRLLDLATVLEGTGRGDAARTAALLATDVAGSPRSPVGDAFLWAVTTRSLAMIVPPPRPDAGDAGGP